MQRPEGTKPYKGWQIEFTGDGNFTASVSTASSDAAWISDLYERSVRIRLRFLAAIARAVVMQLENQG